MMSLIPKPPECVGCPLYGDGWGFSRPEGSGSSRVLIVGEALGTNEMKDGLPFRPYAEAGSVLEKVLRVAGLSRGQFGLWNVLGCKPPKNELSGAPYEWEAIDHCRIHFDAVVKRFQPSVILAMGAVPLRALTGRSGEKQSLKDLRGYAIRSPGYPNIPVIPTYHPSHIKRGAAELLGVVQHDLKRAVALAQGKFTPILDEAEYLRPGYITEPSPEEAEQFVQSALSVPDQMVAFDIETDESIGVEEDTVALSEGIRLIQFSTGEETGIAFPWRDPYIKSARKLLEGSNPKAGHNAYRFDVPILRAAGLKIGGTIHDTMCLWHHMQPDLPAGLQFVASFFGMNFAWKHLSGSNLTLYGVADADACYRIAVRGLRELDLLGLRRSYDRHIVELNGVLEAVSARGILLDPETRQKFWNEIRIEMAEIYNSTQDLVPEEVRERHPRNGYVKTPANPSFQLVERDFEVPDMETGGMKTVKRFCRILDFNPGSPKQLKSYMKLRGHPVPRNFDGKETTSKLELERLAKKTKDPLYKAVLAYKEVAKYESTYLEGYSPGPDGRIHTTFTFRPATGQLSSIRPNCFSKDTEILTILGWVPFPLLQIGTKVAQFNTANKEITFDHPLNYTITFVDGHLKHIYTKKQINMLLTEEHECLVQSRRNSEFKKIPASQYPNDHLQYHAGMLADMPGIELRRCDLILCAALQADGSVDTTGAITWKLTKKRKIDRLRRALKASEIRFNCYKYTDGQTGFRIAARDVPLWLEGKKFFGHWILELSTDNIRFLADEIFYWDGCFTTKANYSSSVKSNADWAQILMVLTGRRAHMRSYHRNPRAKVNWNIDVLKRPYSLTTNRKIESVPYTGMVYCVQMPQGTVIVRYKNSVAVTGNCQNAPRSGRLAGAFRKMFIPASGRRLLELDYRSFHALTLGFEAKDPDYIRMARLDVHSFLAAHLLKLPERDRLVTMVDEELRDYFRWLRSDPNREFIRSRRAKPSILGYGFGLGPNKLYYMNMESYNGLSEAKQTIAMLNSLFPKTAKFRNEIRQRAHSQSRLVSRFGYVRWFHEVFTWNSRKRDWDPGKDSEAAIAFLPANDAFGHIKEVMLRMERNGLNEIFRLINQIHDALKFEVDEGQVEEAALRIKEEMERPSEILVDPVVAPKGLWCEVEIKVGKNWGEMEELKL